MTDQNLLIALKVGDEEHYLFNKFLKSLPVQAEIVLNSAGYVGGLEKNIETRNKNDTQRVLEGTRHFVIYRAPTFENLVTDYFSSTPKASLSEIQDRLKVKIRYKKQDTEFVAGGSWSQSYDGSIDEMVSTYSKLASNPAQVLHNSLEGSENLRKHIMKKRFGKTKVLPTYVSIGLETPDGSCLLKTTGPQGPYSS